MLDSTNNSIVNTLSIKYSSERWSGMSNVGKFFDSRSFVVGWHMGRLMRKWWNLRIDDPTQATVCHVQSRHVFPKTRLRPSMGLQNNIISFNSLFKRQVLLPGVKLPFVVTAIPKRSNTKFCQTKQKTLHLGFRPHSPVNVPIISSTHMVDQKHSRKIEQYHNPRVKTSSTIIFLK